MSSAVSTHHIAVVEAPSAPPTAEVRRQARTSLVQPVAPSLPAQGNSLGCNGCLLPTFQLPWSSRSLHHSVSSTSTSSLSLFSQEMAVQRLREATQRNSNARLVWFALHAVFIGFVLFVDSNLHRAIKHGQYWYYGSYVLAVAVTVGQYLYTAGSSPGYVQEIMAQLEEQDVETIAAGRPLRFPLAAAVTEAPTLQRPLLTPSEPSGSPLSASSSSGSIGNAPAPTGTFVFPLPSRPYPVKAEQTPLLAKPSSAMPTAAPASGAPSPAANPSRLSFFPRTRPLEVGRFVRNDSLQLLRRTDSNRRCPYCNVWQPMRSKHCHDCDKCVLRFDHHCFWVGTCVGQRNHCRFWWYLLYESTLTLWTLLICISAFKWESSPEGWMEHNVLVVVACISLSGLFMFLASLVSFHTWLVLTNQTTYETTRRKRIPYLRYIPDEVYPFSNGFCANVSQFCCTPSTAYPIYTIPSLAELNARADSRTWFRNEYYHCF